MIHTKTKQSGVTLVEILVYAAGVVFIVGTIIILLFNMYRWYDEVTINPRTDQAGITLVDQILRDIRSGATSNPASVFNSDNGSISLSTKVNGATVTRIYSLSGGKISYVDGGMTYIISPKYLTATKFRFTLISTPLSKAIHIDLDLAYRLKNATTTRTYSGVAVLRNSY